MELNLWNESAWWLEMLWNVALVVLPTLAALAAGVFAFLKAKGIL